MNRKASDLKNMTAMLTPTEYRVYKRAKVVRYLQTDGQNQRLVACWRHYCDQSRRPYLRISYSRKHAKLFLDLIQTDLVLSPEAQATITAMCGLVGGTWQKCTPNFVLGKLIPKAQAEPLARLVMHLLRRVPTAIVQYAKRIA